MNEYGIYAAFAFGNVMVMIVGFILGRWYESQTWQKYAAEWRDKLRSVTNSRNAYKQKLEAWQSGEVDKIMDACGIGPKDMENDINRPGGYTE